MPRASRRKPAIRVRPKEELLETIKKEELEIKEQPQPPCLELSEYSCAICGGMFYKLNALSAHVKSVHLGQSDISCGNCNETFPSIEDRDTHTCRIKVDSELFSYMKCIDCGECYHISKNNTHCCGNEQVEEEILTVSTNFSNEYTPSIEAAQFFVKTVYDNASPDPNSFVDVKKTRERKPKTEKDIENYSYDENLKGIECGICGKVLRSLASFSNHKKTHSKSGKYECQLCTKRFAILEYYIRHVRVHTKEKPFRCTFCNKAFSQRSTLNIHNRIHTGEKPYECNVCQKTFRVQDYLNKHMRTHTGEKPYQCELCYKSFSQKSGLSMHKRSVHFKDSDNARMEEKS